MWFNLAGMSMPSCTWLADSACFWKWPFQTPTNEGLSQNCAFHARIAAIYDGQVHWDAAWAAGWMKKDFMHYQLVLSGRLGRGLPFMSVDSGGIVHVQQKQKTAQRFAHALRICRKKNDGCLYPHKMHGKTKKNALPVTEEPYDESGKRTALKNLEPNAMKKKQTQIYAISPRFLLRHWLSECFCSFLSLFFLTFI